MFFDIGWQEFLLIGAVALVVIGPKDLPAALRVAGVWMRKARMLSREFQSSVEQMIRDAELDEMRQQLKKATDFDLNREFQKTIDPTGELAQSIRPPDIPDFFDAPSSSTQTTQMASSPGEADAAPLPALPPPDDEPMLPGFEMPPEADPAAVSEPAQQPPHDLPKS